MYQIRPSTKLGVWSLFLLTLIFIIASFSNRVFGTSNTFIFEFNSKNLKNLVEKNLDGKKGEYAVIIEGLSWEKGSSYDLQKYSLRPFETFPAASLYKLYLLAAVFKKIEEGSLKPDDGITATKQHLTDKLGAVDFGYEDREEKIVYTVEEALQRVGRISDNFASIMLAEEIGWNQVQKQADSLGSLNTNISGSIQTSASDTANFFRKLYKGEIVSPSVSQKILECLSLSKINDRIPAGVPEGVKTVHKTGELSRVRHDAGIVYLPSGEGKEDRAYVIVMLSKNLQYEDEAVETLVNISKDVYEYFSSKK
ncbi:serine hydrolase [Candidatus Daviesbacteria bacterium]|nr:serine hydrolase [Candidatus Daviesbacteria bacterium]